MFAALEERVEMVENVSRTQELVSEISSSSRYQFLPVTDFRSFWNLIFKVRDKIKTLNILSLYG